MYTTNHRSSNIPTIKSERQSDSKETTPKSSTKSDVDEKKSVLKKN